jgi:hypothetical protein
VIVDSGVCKIEDLIENFYVAYATKNLSISFLQIKFGQKFSATYVAENLSTQIPLWGKFGLESFFAYAKHDLSAQFSLCENWG